MDNKPKKKWMVWENIRMIYKRRHIKKNEDRGQGIGRGGGE